MTKLVGSFWKNEYNILFCAKFKATIERNGSKKYQIVKIHITINLLQYCSHNALFCKKILHIRTYYNFIFKCRLSPRPQRKSICNPIVFLLIYIVKFQLIYFIVPRCERLPWDFNYALKKFWTRHLINILLS